MKKKGLIIFSAVLIVSLVVVGIVQAFQMANVDGVWGLIDQGGVTRIDVIGQIGVDPGDQWGTDPDTDNEVLRRKPGICEGDSDGSNAFNPATQWDGFTATTKSGLGSHSVNCGTTNGLIISEYYESDSETARAIEIFNGTGNTVNLQGYSVVVYTNGSSQYTEICFLHGLLANGDVHVLTDGDVDLFTVADETCGAMDFTGDDAVELRRGNEADAFDSRWASGDGDTPGDIRVDYWNQTGPITDTNQIRYGDPQDSNDFADQSGLGFDGVNNLGTITPGNPVGTPSDPFLLGLLTHYNNPILRDVATNVHYNNLYQVPLSITIDGIYCDPAGTIAPDPGSTLTFGYTVTLEETPNELTCPYGNSTGIGCDDRIFISASPASTGFDCEKPGVPADNFGIWTVEIIGFIDNGTSQTCPATPPPGSSPIFNFDSGEQSDSTACLYARVAEFNPTSVTFTDFSSQPKPDGIQVTWETASEVNNSGFYLYRSTTDTKPFEPMTDFIPSSAPGSGEGASYSFLDTKVQSGVRYYYWLESVDFEERSVSEYGPVNARAFHKLFLPLIGR